jgi:alpha-glucosidase
MDSHVGAIGINDAGIKLDENYKVYDFCIKNGLAAKHPDGTNYVGVVWPGDSIFPNYFHPKMKKFWVEEATRFVEETGFDGIWNDMNEPVSFKGELPTDLVFDIPGRKLEHLECHNVYAEHMVAPLAKVFRNKNQRPYLFTRSGFATTSKYAFTWNGDNYSLWHHLRYSIPQIATLGLSNFMFNGVDIGGFGGDCNKQLLIRWAQGNMLIPFFRNHSTLDTKAQEPYAYDEELMNIYRDVLNTRYSLIPYLYNLAKDMNKKGELMLRPMLYNYPEDVNCIDINDQYMVGDSIMVAPIVTQDCYKRIVYFPKGTWIDYFTGKTYKGGKHYMIDMALEETGLYVLANSIIPTYENLQYIDKKEIDTITFNLYGSKGKYELYEDDGETLDYEKGIYNLYKVSFNKDKFVLKVVRNKYNSTYKTIKVAYKGKIYQATFNGKDDVVISLGE